MTLPINKLDPNLNTHQKSVIYTLMSVGLIVYFTLFFLACYNVKVFLIKMKKYKQFPLLLFYIMAFALIISHIFNYIFVVPIECPNPTMFEFLISFSSPVFESGMGLTLLLILIELAFRVEIIMITSKLAKRHTQE